MLFDSSLDEEEKAYTAPQAATVRDVVAITSISARISTDGSVASYGLGSSGSHASAASLPAALFIPRMSPHRFRLHAPLPTTSTDSTADKTCHTASCRRTHHSIVLNKHGHMQGPSRTYDSTTLMGADRSDVTPPAPPPSLDNASPPWLTTCIPHHVIDDLGHELILKLATADNYGTVLSSSSSSPTEDIEEDVRAKASLKAFLSKIKRDNTTGSGGSSIPVKGGEVLTTIHEWIEGGLANKEQLWPQCNREFAISPQVFVEKCMKAWKEIEYEVVCDYRVNCITAYRGQYPSFFRDVLRLMVVLQNFDALGICTGDSILAMPSQALDANYNMPRTMDINVIHHQSVIGECNIHHTLNLTSQEYCSIEFRSSFPKNARVLAHTPLGQRAPPRLP
ncbi:hypothetical protein HYPSUDRAFT_203586 [Hypholoma sublateritium FD-334 SS-4]|uniref:Carbamoyl phosphate synthase ATP-binding domain-containing protein n=1 Tax=Hypholoma sublateritium (strain FD-334 SS-4) TaxID=945553 RepID=A0A0D2MB38_HYPSF|nr:hypothetical protein HYPSUDRAFT_203586 [Hypholoma sublateritium FD-334 SS-4]